MLALTQALEIMGSYIHDIVKDYKGSTSGLLLIANTNLTYAAISSKQVVQVLAGDLVVQVLDEEDAVCARRQLRLWEY